VKRHNIEFLWGWFDALRRRDTESMAAAFDPGIVWQGVRPDLVCHGAAEVTAAFLTAYDTNQEIDSLELLAGDGHVVLGAQAQELAIDDVDTGGEIYNVFTIEAGKITHIADYLERKEALAAAGITTGPVHETRLSTRAGNRRGSARRAPPTPRRSAGCCTTSTPSSTTSRPAPRRWPSASCSSWPAVTRSCCSRAAGRTG
jgi:limonene-1,2-epoxide hydrolase